ncbi:FUSC family protein [Vagococcus sp. DIV0080]|uniref:FUSC family protein n=1 Tax=Candidatus Vagococcus giribetii TaxID=2230876 RepID=A0ABS3HUY2_9ENTE|nr:aromatic acid exporter family protein [Vagococcus sp. DIV0080]MBO0477552.1 FUSC family protein [Vagococcus sp. DIV0080]
MRTIKTGLSVFFCILISFIFNRETYVVSSITAIFTLREDMYNTVKFGRHRVVGNVLGALFSVVAIFIFKTFGDGKLVQLIAIPLLIILLIGILSSTKNYEGTVGACATLLTILFMIPESQSYAYAFDRVVDSFIGMLIAFGINRAIPYPYKKYSRFSKRKKISNFKED